MNNHVIHDQSSSNMNTDHSNNSNSCSDLHSIINEQSFHDQSSSSMNIGHSNSSNSHYCVDFELYNTETFQLIPYDKLIHKKPFKGLLFHSLDIGLDFYKTYGQESGFDVNMSSQKRYNDGTIRIRYSTCSRSGFTESFKYENINVKFSDVKRRRTSSKKKGCLAVSKFKNLQCSLMFYIYVFVEDHNHELVAQDQLHLLRLIGQYSQMVVDILTNRKLCFSNFSFDVQKDADDHLTRLFWADDTLKANYKEFGDVLSFDATYQTNKYSMVFVLFTGVDCHKHCVTFAAGLLAREIADAYVWLLEVLRKAFFKPPMMIIIDQDSSMKKAINFVFPKLKHRLYMWHITHKLEEKFMMSFDSAMEKQRHHQSLLDYHSTTTTPKLMTHLAIEKHASEIYTHNIFLDTQKKLYKSVFYYVQKSVVIEDESEVYVLRDKKKKVVFSRRGDSISISFSCMLFGKDIIGGGLLRKKYSYPHKGGKSECLIQDAHAILRLSINKIENNEDELAKYIKQLQEVDSGIPLCTSSRASSSRAIHIEKIIGDAVPDVINIHNPEGIRNKGWASGKRIKSTREKVIEKSKKGSRLCSLCHKPNHNARSCILRLKKCDLESEVTEG
ncbi:uncharacterized protein LOC111881310 [Lactuca sativa]|uniref:uncharacterized protein LOC111881310 n=1 Tax=Lactuca sativa TaxID=4236 RepID=UPI000CD8B063|nr:uncharacterized protein LOC111881310 [Lactuca sativa]